MQLYPRKVCLIGRNTLILTLKCYYYNKITINLKFDKSYAILFDMLSCDVFVRSIYYVIRKHTL